MAQPPPQNNITIQSSNFIPTLPHTFGRSGSWLDMINVYLNACSSTNLTEDQKFLAVYNALPSDLREEESDLLTSVSVTKYTELQTRLRIKFETPIHHQFAILTSQELIGDRSPSQFFSYIKKGYTKAGVTNDEAIKLAYAKGMPDKYKVVIQMADANNLEDVARKLDGMWSLDKGKTSQVNMLGHTGAKDKEIADLTKRIEELSNITQSLTRRDVVDKTPRIQNNSISNQGSRDPQNQAQNYGYQNNKAANTHNNQQQSRSNYQGAQGYQRSNNYQGAQGYKNANNYQGRDSLQGNSSCPEPPNRYRTYGLCITHVRYGTDAYRCADPRNCKWPTFRVPMHRCNQDRCEWYKYLHQTPYTNFQNRNYNDRKN